MKRFILVLFFLGLSFFSYNIIAEAQDADPITCNACHAPTTEAVAQGPHADVDCSTCHEGADQHAQSPTEVTPGIDVSDETCGSCHEWHWESYRAVEKVDQQPQKMEKFPLMPKLLSGHAFAKDYREPREHFNMLEDVELTTRGKGATCFSCKSADFYVKWQDEIKFDSNVDALLTDGVVSHPITCVNCHDPHETELRTVNIFLHEALEEMPDDHPAQNDLDRMGNMLCSQCHVNYNFNVAEEKNVFPWRKLEDMLEYTQEFDFWQDHATGGWNHPELDQVLYKVQHPEVELYWESTHWNLGITCTDCHMPKVEAEDGQIYTEHWITSPLNNPLESCADCHQQGEDDLRNLIETIQEETYDLMQETMEVMSIAVDEIEEARLTDNINADLLSQARDAYFISHLNWEWIAAENSMGFHNPPEAREALVIAKEKAEEATTLARRAIDEPDDAAADIVDPEDPAERNIIFWVVIIGVLLTVAYFVLRKK